MADQLDCDTRCRVTQGALTDRVTGSRSVAACAPASEQRRDLTWVDLVNRYSSPRDCLAAFIVSCTAEVLAGVKPASLLRLVRRTLPCGRCMYQLWQEYGNDLLNDSSLQVVVLRTDEEGSLLLFYRHDLLYKRLSGKTMQTFLRRAGYPEPISVNGALRHLQVAFSQGESPDEVGMFLGYPLKDVSGFIARKNQPWEGRCMWRVYGPPRRSLRLYQRFCDERRAMTDLMMSGNGPAALLKAS